AKVSSRVSSSILASSLADQRYARQSPTQPTSHFAAKTSSGAHSATVAAPGRSVTRAIASAIVRSAPSIALATRAASSGCPSSAMCSWATSRRLAVCAIVPPPTPSATTNSRPLPSSGLCASSLAACWLPHDDATAASRRHAAFAYTACSGAAASRESGPGRVVRPGSIGVMSESGAISVFAVSGQDERARGLARQRAAEDDRLAGPPVEAFARRVRDAVDGDAVVALDDTVRAVVVEGVDRDVLPRHAGMAAVDHDRLVARAADGERKRV